MVKNAYTDGVSRRCGASLRGVDSLFVTYSLIDGDGREKTGRITLAPIACKGTIF